MSEELCATWRRFRATRDPALRDLLIRQTIGLVRRVAGRLALRLPPHLEVDDLESAGIPGLLAAIESYDPEAHVEFAAFATARIRGAILDELRSLDPLPRSLREKGREIERAVARLQQRMVRPPTDDEIAGELGISLESYHRTLLELRGGLHVSLESGWGGDGERSEEPSLSDGATPDPWQHLALKERRRLLAAVIDELPAKERTVLSLYYFDELTMKEIGAVLEVSESRVSQIHSAALLRIRARLQRRRLREEDLRLAPVGSPGAEGELHALG